MTCTLVNLRRRLPVFVSALASVLLLALSACSSVYIPPTPTPGVHGPVISNVCPDRPTRQNPPGYSLPATLPLVDNGVVYVGYSLPDPPDSYFATIDLNRNYVDRFALTALRVRDGVALWHVPTAHGLWPYTVTGAWPLAVEAGILVVHDTGADPGLAPGDLVGLRASDGAMLWRMQLNFQTVTVRSGIIYVGASDAILAVRLADGSLIWRTPLDGAPFSAPLLVGSSLYTSRSVGAVIALRADTGTVLWDHTFDTEGVGSLPLGVIAGWLYVYVPSNVQHGVDSGVLRLNPASGVDQGYELRLPRYVEALNPALQADIFYAVIDSVDMSVTTPSELAAYRLSSTGSQLLWRAPLPDHPAYEVSYDAETAYVRTLARSGTISAYHLSDGELLWSRQAHVAARPSIAAGDGETFEVTYGMVAPCRTPPIHQAPQIRAYASADGGAIWARDLDDKL